MRTCHHDVSQQKLYPNNPNSIHNKSNSSNSAYSHFCTPCPATYHSIDLLSFVIFSPLGKDLNFTHDRMFCAQPLKFVHCLEIDLGRFAGASDKGREPLDLGEGCLQTVPLRGDCLRPSAMVKGSVEVTPSVQRANFLTSGRPAKS